MIEKEIAFQLEHKLTPSQLCLLRILHAGMHKDIFEWYLMVMEKEPTLKQQIMDLHPQGWLLKRWNLLQDEYPDMLELSEFGKQRLTELEGEEKRFDPSTYGEELYSSFPTYGMIKGNQVYLKNLTTFQYKDKLYSGIEGLSDMYTDILKKLAKLKKTSVDKLHKEVMDKIAYGKRTKSPSLNMNIVNFVLSRGWEAIDNKGGTDVEGFEMV